MPLRLFPSNRIPFLCRWMAMKFLACGRPPTVSWKFGLPATDPRGPRSKMKDGTRRPVAGPNPPKHRPCGAGIGSRAPLLGAVVRPVRRHGSHVPFPDTEDSLAFQLIPRITGGPADRHRTPPRPAPE